MPKYPVTRIEPVTNTLHGAKVTENYRWLEQGGSPDVKAWTKQQNELTHQQLKTQGFTAFREELARDFKAVMFTNPRPVKGAYFWEERQPDEDQWVLYTKRGLDGQPQKLIDTNQMSTDKTISLDYWAVSPEGTYLTYGLSQGGDENSTLYIMDLRTGKQLNDVIPHTRYASIAWLSDESGFYYTRFPKPGMVPENEEQYHQRVRFHKLGDDPEQDSVIFGEGRDKLFSYGLTLSSDDRYLCIGSSKDWLRNDLFMLDTETQKFHCLTEAVDAKFYLAMTASHQAIVLTNYEANNWRILTSGLATLPNKFDQWEELVPEQAEVLKGFSLTADRLLAIYSVNVSSKVMVYDHSGKFLEELPLPKYSCLAGISGRRDEREFFLGHH